jgi:hypothetical protein
MIGDVEIYSEQQIFLRGSYVIKMFYKSCKRRCHCKYSGVCVPASVISNGWKKCIQLGLS